MCNVEHMLRSNNLFNQIISVFPLGILNANDEINPYMSESEVSFNAGLIRLIGSYVRLCLQSLVAKLFRLLKNCQKFFFFQVNTVKGNAQEHVCFITNVNSQQKYSICNV